MQPVWHFVLQWLLEHRSFTSQIPSAQNSVNTFPAALTPSCVAKDSSIFEFTLPN